MSADKKVVRGNLRCRVLTPERLVFDEMVQSVELNTAAGTIEVFAHHEPTIAPLEVGVMRAKGNDGSVVELAVHGGYMDMNGQVLVILADSAEVGSEIDVERARKALERAREMLAGVTSDNARNAADDVDRARLAILRALTRLRAAGESPPEM
ncbi:MAG: ATP synthase F1 subunit epsilon [Planctomycetota bacterium]|jgi:F-type H+-transporting ATPase subunit epsilon|nr:ATP synthase F1 subunit epsilon [Planctomycetota bacterium]